MKILIAKEDHGNRYFDASTPELEARAHLKLLRERLSNGEYYDPDIPAAPLPDEQMVLDLTDEDLESMPGPVARKMLNRRTALEKEYERRKKEFLEAKYFHDAIKTLCALSDEDALAQRSETSGTYWVSFLAYKRSKYNYEDYDIETLEEV